MTGSDIALWFGLGVFAGLILSAMSLLYINWRIAVRENRRNRRTHYAKLDAD